MYTLNNPESDFKKGLVKESEDKRRFSIYIPSSLIQYLDKVAEERELGSRNKAIIQTIKHYQETHSEELNNSNYTSGKPYREVVHPGDDDSE